MAGSPKATRHEHSPRVLAVALSIPAPPLRTLLFPHINYLGRCVAVVVQVRLDVELIAQMPRDHRLEAARAIVGIREAVLMAYILYEYKGYSIVSGER